MPDPAPEKTPMHVRIATFIDYLEENGGAVVALVDQLAETLEWSDRTVMRVTKKAVEVGAIARRRQGTVGGRLPNRYEARVSSAEWRERGEKLLRSITARKVSRAASRREERKRENARAEVMATLPPVATNDPMIAIAVAKVRAEVAPGMDEDEVDAWLETEIE